MLNPNVPLSFTAKYPSKQNSLTTHCHVVNPYPEEGQVQTPFQCNAIWDTGATNSVISQRVVDALGLAPIGYTSVMGVAGKHDCPQFSSGILLPNNVHFEKVLVTLGQLNGFDVLIGMDIISAGSFAITHRTGATVFSFSIPTVDTIDYVQKYPPKKQGNPQPYKKKHS
ncbi:MAG: retroviral-like aspartic protease family protein [Polynucleobacter sp.]|uniref:retroviral-like aspartic protease family protein n=1 Tax=Polynucleobacter sp. TaxID=2029855 RepID=UPI00271C60E0|nr:retroviral-like aspartic protease family protein [Polynucleobacter sp.]MDO8714259.1 retroviral-like aspartic protease family protein [Polynucleobacter sp.]